MERSTGREPKEANSNQLAKPGQNSSFLLGQLIKPAPLLWRPHQGVRSMLEIAEIAQTIMQALTYKRSDQ